MIFEYSILPPSRKNRYPVHPVRHQSQYSSLRIPSLSIPASVLQPSADQPRRQERRKDVELRVSGSAKLGVDAHGALGQEAQQARDPVDGTHEGRRPHVLAVHLGRRRPPPGVVQRREAKGHGQADRLRVVESREEGQSIWVSKMYRWVYSTYLA